jgi:hypothetical protein
MSLLRALLAGTTALALTASVAHAATVTNRDTRDHKVTIIEGETKKDLTLKPQQALDGICAKECILRLNDSEDDEYQIEPDDLVSIEEGNLYYDSPETPAPQGKPGEKPKQ